jgi:hypothetical protein
VLGVSRVIPGVLKHDDGTLILSHTSCMGLQRNTAACTAQCVHPVKHNNQRLTSLCFIQPGKMPHTMPSTSSCLRPVLHAAAPLTAGRPQHTTCQLQQPHSFLELKQQQQQEAARGSPQGVGNLETSLLPNAGRHELVPIQHKRGRSPNSSASM